MPRWAPVRKVAAGMRRGLGVCPVVDLRGNESGMDVLTLLIMAAFYLLFFASIARYLRHRHPLELSVVLVFTSTAAIFAITTANLLAPGLTPYLSPVAILLLVAQPALMIRLVGSIVPLPRW